MPELIVVSGLPRSGTSMMMSALRSGGVSLLTDGVRAPDESNPLGYFEFQPVRRLAEDASWLAEHEGMAVKIIYRLLYHIPPTVPTRVIFMERPLSQVLRSQEAMLGGAAADGTDWAKIFGREVDRVHVWMAKQPSMQVLRVNYEDFLGHPLQQSQRIATFLGLPLNAQAMAAVVDPNLHRQRP